MESSKEVDTHRLNPTFRNDTPVHSDRFDPSTLSNTATTQCQSVLPVKDACV